MLISQTGKKKKKFIKYCVVCTHYVAVGIKKIVFFSMYSYSSANNRVVKQFGIVVCIIIIILFILVLLSRILLNAFIITVYDMIW